MIPPSQNLQQALQMQQSMAQQQPQDPLMQALQHQAMTGDLLKQTADHKMKLLKIRQKYGRVQMRPGFQAQAAPQGAY